MYNNNCIEYVSDKYHFVTEIVQSDTKSSVILIVFILL